MEWWGWVATVLGAIVLISQGVKAIKDLISPAVTLREKVDAIAKQSEQDSKRFSELEDKISKQGKTIQALASGMLALINHSIDGNGIQGLKEARTELLDHFIEKE